MSTEPMIESGTFGSVSKTTTFYPYKSYQPLQWFNTLFFLVFGISIIAPDLTIMVVSKVINIAPDLATELVTPFMEPEIRIPFIVVAAVMELLCIYLLFIRANFVSSQ